MESKLLLVGAGNMAIDYAHVLNHLEQSFDTVCRTQKSANNFTEKTSKPCMIGGLDGISEFSGYEMAIIATPVLSIFDCAKTLIENGVTYLLIEKPGGIDEAQIAELNQISSKHNSKVFIAYNRRFYQSVQEAKKIIQEDGGGHTAQFDFTEWSHVIQGIDMPNELKKNWFLANSTHVVDLAFYLIGKPTELSAYQSGNLSWHKPSKFSGSGITDKNILFHYGANWESAGRWSLEITTAHRKLIFCPLEELKSQHKGTIAIINVENIDYSKDKSYKAGIYEQTKAFLNREQGTLKPLEEQVNDFKFYNKILGK